MADVLESKRFKHVIVPSERRDGIFKVRLEIPKLLMIQSGIVQS